MGKATKQKRNEIIRRHSTVIADRKQLREYLLNGAETKESNKAILNLAKNSRDPEVKSVAKEIVLEGCLSDITPEDILDVKYGEKGTIERLHYDRAEEFKAEGERLYSLRKTLGYSLHQMADMAKITVGVIKAIEEGTTVSALNFNIYSDVINSVRLWREQQAHMEAEALATPPKVDPPIMEPISGEGIPAEVTAPMSIVTED